MPRSKLVQILKATYTGALIIRNGFWGPLYYTYNTEPPKIVLVIVKAPFFSPMHPHLLENTDPGRLTLVERVSILMEISDRGGASGHTRSRSLAQSWVPAWCQVRGWVWGSESLGFRRSHSDNPGEACGSRFANEVVKLGY